jgi:beta-mannosidase
MQHTDRKADRIDLCGQWMVSRAGTRERLAAVVPGCIHADLLRAGKIEDPFHRDNETKQFWVGESSWNYARTFEVPAALLACDRVCLVCEGLDTLSTVLVNGATVGSTDNMFRSWEFDVKAILKPGMNRIEIHFTSPLGRKDLTADPACSPATPMDLPMRTMVRKEQCNFGWDWGPKCLTCGIWRPIRIVAFNTARLAGVHVRQSHSKAKAGAVGLSVAVEAVRTRAALLEALVEVCFEGRVLQSRQVSVKNGRAEARFVIAKPKLWWPRGMGDQHLYQVKTTLLCGGEPLDVQVKRIGLRRLELIRKKDGWGESFHFEANGVRFFAKGANWIPADPFQSRVTPQVYRHLLESAAEANMNFVRVWGGGIYEDDLFYDVCDELGICVWQDFMFACAVYPAGRDFLANVRREVRENVRRIRHHASLALWCGNNELEQGWEEWGWTRSKPAFLKRAYARMFHEAIPAIVKAEDPERQYWPSSSSSGRPFEITPNDPRMGDGHLWSVWHGREPFEWYRTAFHRFCSEFGFQSFPEPATVRGYTAPGDRNVSSRVMELHQRSGIGNATILHYMLSWYRMPDGFENTLWLSQLQQGLAIKYAVEHWRRNMPRCMGALYWQLNDTWPVASWASIDYHGRWKALQYMAKRFFAPVLISGVENAGKGTVEVHLTSDGLRRVDGAWSWNLTRVDGTSLARGGREAAGARQPHGQGYDSEAREMDGRGRGARSAALARVQLRGQGAQPGPCDVCPSEAPGSAGAWNCRAGEGRRREPVRDRSAATEAGLMGLARAGWGGWGLLG